MASPPHPGTSEDDIGEATLDPTDWTQLRALAHRAVDDSIDHLAGRSEQPVWRPMPDEVRASFAGPLPRSPAGANAAYEDFITRVAPYSMGNDHARFWGWYMGAGNPVGNIADLLASVHNANLGGGDHAPVLVERQTVAWCAEAAGYPPGASGLFVSGASEANLVGLAVARSAAIGPSVRHRGLDGRPYAVYASSEVHSCHRKSCELLGLGAGALRQVPVLDDYSMDVAALADAIATDRANGVTPVAVVATAGTVNTGATDDLGAIADLVEHEGIWLHVDGAIGGFLNLGGEAGRVRGIERADSVALDLHKWMQAPMDVGLVLVRDPSAHRGTFSVESSYLTHSDRGLSGSDLWYTELGIALSRGFRALRVWMAFTAYGADAFGRVMDANIAQAHHLATAVEAAPDLELLAPVGCDIVCFRYAPGGLTPERLDEVTHEVTLRLHESGVAIVSETQLRGRHAMRCAIGNHRTRTEDLDLLVTTVRRLGSEVLAELGGEPVKEPTLAP